MSEEREKYLDDLARWAVAADAIGFPAAAMVMRVLAAATLANADGAFAQHCIAFRPSVKMSALAVGKEMPKAGAKAPKDC